MRLAVAPFIVKLRLSVIRRIVVAEEIRPSDTIELHEVTHDVGTHRIVLDAPLLHLMDPFGQLFPVFGIDHVFPTLGSGIAAFQPVAIGAFLWRHRRTDGFHDGL